jgi:hypothetical protein
MVSKDLNNIYEQLIKIDSHVASTYKEAVFKHIERILVKYGIDGGSSEPTAETPNTKDVNLIKIAIKNLVDYL